MGVIFDKLFAFFNNETPLIFSRNEGKTMQQDKIVVFQSKNIRRVRHNDEWYFSVVDACGALTDSLDAGAYWLKPKQRLRNEGSQVVTNCHGLKLEASDGKEYTTDCANTKSMSSRPSSYSPRAVKR